MLTTLPDVAPTGRPAARDVADREDAGRRRFSGLEAYRGIAAVLVVVFHDYQYTGEPYRTSARWAHVLLHDLDALVDLFFVLSAFLLTLPWVRASLDGRPAESPRGYLLRRAIRVLPVYWVVILVVWSCRNGSLATADWTDLLEHLTFTQVFDPTRIFYTVGPAWSLSVEVMFYAFLLLAALIVHRLCLRLASRAGRIALWVALPAGLWAVSAGWTAWSLYVRHVPQTSWPTWFGPMAKAGVFAAGMLLAVLVAALPRDVALRGAWPTVLRVLGLGLVGWLAVWRGDATGPHEEWVHLPLGMAFALVLAASVLGPEHAPWGRLLSSRPLAVLGLVSYSVYLWHEPLLLLLGGRSWGVGRAAGDFPTGTLVLLLASLVAGWLSYWVIEHPVASVRTRINRRGRLRNLYDT